VSNFSSNNWPLLWQYRTSCATSTSNFAPVGDFGVTGAKPGRACLLWINTSSNIQQSTSDLAHLCVYSLHFTLFPNTQVFIVSYSQCVPITRHYSRMTEHFMFRCTSLIIQFSYQSM